MAWSCFCTTRDTSHEQWQAHINNSNPTPHEMETTQ